MVQLLDKKCVPTYTLIDDLSGVVVLASASVVAGRGSHVCA